MLMFRDYVGICCAIFVAFWLWDSFENLRRRVNIYNLTDKKDESEFIDDEDDFED